MRLDARVSLYGFGWAIYIGATSEPMNQVVYLDTVTREYGRYDDPPQLDPENPDEVRIYHLIAKRIDAYPDTKVARIWP